MRYKFFPIVKTTNGFVLHFILDSRLAVSINFNADGGTNEYHSSTNLSKTAKKITLIIVQATSTYVQEKRLFVIEIDNVFTVPKVLKALLDAGIGSTSIGRAKQGWVPQRHIVSIDSTSNDFFGD